GRPSRDGPFLLRRSETRLDRSAPCARVAGQAGNQARIARPDAELVDIILIEGIADPGKEVEAALRPEPGAEVRQRIALDPGIGRRRRVRRPVRPIAAVIAEIELPILVEELRLRIDLGPEGKGPFRNPRQPLARNIAVRRTVRPTRLF